MTFQVGAGVSDQGEAGGVGFGESIERERSDRENNFFLRFRRDSIGSHPAAEFGLDLFHASLRALESHGAAKIFSFASSEVRGDHRNAQKLFLKKRDAQRALQHGFE